MIDDVVKPVAPPTEITKDMVYATHEGLLKIGDFEIRVYILNTGQRFINAEDIDKYFKP